MCVLELELNLAEKTECVFKPLSAICRVSAECQSPSSIGFSALVSETLSAMFRRSAQESYSTLYSVSAASVSLDWQQPRNVVDRNIFFYPKQRFKERNIGQVWMQLFLFEHPLRYRQKRFPCWQAKSRYAIARFSIIASKKSTNAPDLAYLFVYRPVSISCRLCCFSANVCFDSAWAVMSFPFFFFLYLPCINTLYCHSFKEWFPCNSQQEHWCWRMFHFTQHAVANIP